MIVVRVRYVNTLEVLESKKIVKSRLSTLVDSDVV